MPDEDSQDPEEQTQSDTETETATTDNDAGGFDVEFIETREGEPPERK